MSAYSPAITALIHKLASDERTAFLSSDQAAMAADFYLSATDRDQWSAKTQAARVAWMEKFEKTTEALLALMAEAPTTPESWGFPARDNVLMNVAYRWGVELPPHSNTMAFFTKMQELEHAADAELWTLADSLKHYRQQQRAAARVPQTLKKPADAKAGRAQFIVEFHSATGLSAYKMAAVASVLFNEPVDDRVVRRLIP